MTFGNRIKSEARGPCSDAMMTKRNYYLAEIMSEDPRSMINPLQQERTTAPEVDWKALADRRLRRLTLLEHDVAVMRERFERLRFEHDALSMINDDRLKRLQALQASIERYDENMAELARWCALMEASLSWRITAPLRGFAALARRAVPTLLGAVRWLVRSTGSGPFFAHVFPGLHARVRHRLHP